MHSYHSQIFVVRVQLDVDLLIDESLGVFVIILTTFTRHLTSLWKEFRYSILNLG